jgi:hypothetical protein
MNPDLTYLYNVAKQAQTELIEINKLINQNKPKKNKTFKRKKNRKNKSKNKNSTRKKSR